MDCFLHQPYFLNRSSKFPNQDQPESGRINYRPPRPLSLRSFLGLSLVILASFRLSSGGPMSSRSTCRRRRSSPQNSNQFSSRRRCSKPPKPTRRKQLRRCSSEPLLVVPSSVEEEEPEDGALLVLLRPRTCLDIFPSSLPSPSPSPSRSSLAYEKYGDESKVVLSVLVEGSPGPVRTMVRLGASVAETIRIVVDKYREEGRSPLLGRDASHSSFQLHHSYFSLQSLNKTEKIGSVGSRNFYLRRSNGDEREEGNSASSDHDKTLVKSNLPLQPLFSSSIAKRLGQIARRTRKIWKLLGCVS
ncbi:hypothetical protein H6P81_016726 [Aristolochia fimbriata]|uniref:DUF7054 domain-containing protein n=1 Tax=Aristolochia fimbriata TaxID=158543 RepID=A0AAV7EAD4_ARIFI|nr:hypothetical protein H6P81_016726 [Aristolochia fimbriata]